MDQIDRKLIRLLEQDGRLTMQALADAVGLSKSPVQARVKRLERAGVIRGYTARVDHPKLGLGHVSFVQVSLADTRAAALAAFNAAVARVPEIVGCHMIAGNFDYLLKIRTRDMAHYRSVLADGVSALPHVSHTSTYPVMEVVRDG